MPSKKKKYNARFPAGRIKKIMQSDEEVGKVAQAVPVIISRTLELFVESLLTKTLKITNSRNAKTLSTSHMKQCIMSEQRFDFLRELVKNIPDISVAEEAASYNEDDAQSSPEEQYPDSDTPFDLSMPSTSTRATRTNASNGGNERVGKMVGQNGVVSVMNTQHDEPCQAPVKRDAEIVQRLQRRVSNTGHSAHSVIVHTTSVANVCSTDCLPAKLLRSDSTPVAASTQPQSDSLPQRQRLKHQSLSLPSNTNIKNSAVPPTGPTKQQQPAIPPPIVSIDFCNKPVVKIDYSNLPLISGISLPASVPDSTEASEGVGGSSSDFDFGTEPVINIDLSNIVTNAASATTTNVGTAVATISIGPPAAAAPASANTSNVADKTAATKTPNSKALMAAPFTSTNTTDATTTKNTVFEMDEDYDNI